MLPKDNFVSVIPTKAQAYLPVDCFLQAISLWPYLSPSCCYMRTEEGRGIKLLNFYLFIDAYLTIYKYFSGKYHHSFIRHCNYSAASCFRVAETNIDLPKTNTGYFHPSIREHFFLYSALNYTNMLKRCEINF